MNVKAYALYDSKGLMFTLPSFFPNDGVALRAYHQMAREPNHPIALYPADYTIYAIGEYDDSTGNLTSTPPRSIIVIAELVEASKPG